MATTTKKAASVKNSNAAANVELGNSVEQAGIVIEEQPQKSIFDRLAEESVETRSVDDIIRQLVLNPNCKRINNLHIRNVVATAHETYTQLTFIVKEFVFGDVRDNEHLDAFGQPTIKLGKTHNIMSSSIAVGAIMKNVAKQAVFAQEVIDMTAPLAQGQESAIIDGRANKANMLFAGGTIDVICQYVPAHTDFINPFASDPTPKQFNADKIIHHVVRLSLGEVGEDAYKAYIFG